MKNITPLIIFILVSCEEGTRRGIDSGLPKMMLEMPKAENDETILNSFSSALSMKQAISKKEIKNASLTVKVNSLDGFEEKVKKSLSKFDAYTSNSGVNSNNYRKNIHMTIRVKSSQFDSLMIELEQLGEFTESKNINTRDVTEEFIDVEAKLKHKRAAEAQYLKILKQAKNVRDILSVQNQLQQIRSEIDSQEGRLKYLSNQVDYSTIQFTLYELLANEIQPQSGFFSRIGQALISGWNRIIDAFVWLIGLWPFIIVVVLLIVWRRSSR